MDLNLEDAKAIAVRLAQEAGEVAMAYFNHPHRIDTKQNIFDIVTEADKAAEEMIVRGLRAAFPRHHIVGEEGGGMGAPADETDYFWYIDPIDGTSNYANRIPYFSVSIALAARGRQPLVGVVLNPAYDEMFSALRGGGAFFNGAPLRVSKTGSLNQAILGSGFPTNKQAGISENLPEWGRLMRHGVRGLRRFGSAALDMAQVAAGRFDGFWEHGIQPWDCLAGILCVQEAGGRTTDFSGGTAHLYTGAEVIVTNGHIHDELLRVLNHNGG